MFTDKVEKIRNLSRNFQHTRVYDASVPSYRASWAFVIGVVPRHVGDGLVDVKTIGGLQNFDSPPDAVNRILKERLLPKATMANYEGVVQHGFQYPSADWKGVYCMTNPEVCKNPMAEHTKMDSYERSLWNPMLDTLRYELTSKA